MSDEEDAMLAIISDIHANLGALKAVLAQVEGAEAILCCGDIVGYGPQPNECCELLRERGVLSVKGNHDQTCATLDRLEEFRRRAAQAAVWTHRQLTDENREWLNGLPLQLEHSGFSVVHGCPGSSTEKLGTYVLSEWLDRDLCRELMARVGGRYLLLGHTHVPMRYRSVLNPGSVGLPRDGDWRPSYLTIGSTRGRSSLGHRVAARLGLWDLDPVLHRVEYDRAALARRMELGPEVPAAALLTVGADARPVLSAG
jgi:putative phosphoesterase